MTISLPNLNKINLQEVNMLKSILGVTYDLKSKSFELGGGFSVEKLLSIYHELKSSIWNMANTQLAVQEMEQEDPLRTRLHYFGNGRPVSLESYLSKMGLLEYDVLVEDPLCFPLTVKPDYKDHIVSNPKAYIKHVFENSLTMIYLEDWIRKGYIYFVPSLPLFDIGSFWKLAKANEQLSTEKDFEHQPGTIKSIRYSLVEGKINLMIEASRLMQNHYTINHIKENFPGITDDEATKRLELLKSETLIEREGNIVNWALEKSHLTDIEKVSLISYFERTRPFNIERFLDVKGLDEGLMQTAGMPLLQATYLSERFRCIPSTDNLGLIYGYEGWCQALGQNFEPGFENTRAKVEMPFSFLSNLPLDFVEKARQQGKGLSASTYLDQEWSAIRNANNLENYKIAAEKFSQKIARDFDQISNQHEIMIDELLMGLVGSELKGLGAFAAFNLVTEMPTAIIGTLAVIIGSIIDTSKNYRRNTHELKTNPLSIFLEAKKNSKTFNKLRSI